MASLFGMLLDTMPFAAAAQAISDKAGKQFEDCDPCEVQELITMLPPDASLEVDLPAVDLRLEDYLQPLWAFTHKGSDPAMVEALYCRVHDANYTAHCVTERLEWGLEDPVDVFQKAVRVNFKAGGQVLLPLTTENVLWKFRVRGGYLAEDQTPLWRLTSSLDTSLVVVFAYDVDPATGEVKKMDVERIRDTTLRDEVKKAMEAVKELFSADDSRTNVGPGAPPPPPERVPSNVAWGSIVMRGDLFPSGSESGTPGAAPVPNGVSGSVGQVCDVMTEPARLLVVFSFATCCQRADFDPGGMVGFARCYPHLLVSATVPVEKIEASCHLDRPKELLVLDEPGREKGSCCKPPYDGAGTEIRGLLVADENDQKCPITIIGGPPLPFWSNMFAYMLVDPYRVAEKKMIHVVKSDRRHSRVSDRDLVHRATVAGSSQDTVLKHPYQGEFDNVHIAPRLRLMHVDEVVVPVSGKVSFPVTDRVKWRFDEIAMAPFCAHDCLHMHWRWPLDATAKWTLGWGLSGPYQSQGAPMVPIGQDVWVWFRADHRFTYHVTAPPSTGPTGWTVLMHHGFGHAVAIEAWFRTGLAMASIDSFSHYYFTAGTNFVSPRESTAVYYWMARYDVKVEDGEARPVERISWKSMDDLREARDL